MDESEDQGPEWFNQQETKARHKLLSSKVEKARLALYGKCAGSSDPEVRAAHAELQTYTAAAALLKPTL